jgi:hypothetical protein
MRRIAVMTTLGLLVLFGAGLAAGLGDGVAHAAPVTTDPGLGQSELQQCIGDAPIGVDPPPTCTFDPSGNLIGRTQSDPTGAGSTPNFLPFIFLVLLWSAVPFLIAAGLARSRGEPVGTAVLLTLVLGWVGLLIVVYGQRRTVDDIAGLAGRAGATDISTPSGSPVAAPDAAATRLARIEDLHARGLITDAERESRRAAILDQL